MTLLVSFLVAHLGAIIGLTAGIGGILFGIFSNKSAQATKATAAASVAQAHQQIATASQQIAQENAQASEAQTQAVENASKAQDISRLSTASTIDQQLDAAGALRKE